MSTAAASGVSRAAAWHEARALAWQHRRLLGAALLLVTVNRAAVLAIPFASRVLVDDVLVEGRGDRLLPIAAVAAAGVAVQCASGWGVSQLTGVGALRAITGVRTALHAHLLHLPVGFFDRTRTGALIARVMTDTEQLRVLVGSGVAHLASGALGSVLSLGILVALDVRLTLAIVLVLALLVATTVRGFGRVHDAFRDVSARGAELTGRLTESVGGIRTVKACVAERREAAAFGRGADALLRAGMQAVRDVSILGAAATLATGMVSLLVLTLGGAAVAAGTMTPGDLAMCAILAGLLGAPLIQMAALTGEVGRALAALGRVGELRALETEPVHDRARGARPVRRLRGDVELDGVCFAYAPDGPLALADVSFAAAAGSTTALVGPSGSGKSTICRLLLAFDRPARGRVLVDGCDLASLDRSEYRRHVGVVLQEGFLFDATVAENIRYARPQATDAEVRAAARTAQCAELIAALPHGYATLVGERGVALSGGERQRIAIARALLADPRILILDEATSALDAENEALVQAALRALRQGRTTFVVAHHGATVADADRVVVLERGRVRTCGSPTDPIPCRQSPSHPNHGLEERVS